MSDGDEEANRQIDTRTDRQIDTRTDRHTQVAIERHRQKHKLENNMDRKTDRQRHNTIKVAINVTIK